MVGRAQINVGSNDNSGAFINFLKGLNAGNLFTDQTDAGKLDADGYPIATLGNNVGGNVPLPSGLAGSTVDWVIKWPATRTAKFVINVPVTKSSSTFATTSGGSNSVLVVGGAGGRAVFRFNSYSTTSFGIYFPLGAFYAAGAGEIVICRLSDEAAYDAGEYFTPEFIALLTDLNPKTIRPMGWAHNDGNYTNEVQWRYRSTPTSLSWGQSRYLPGCWGGTISGTDTMTIGAAPDTPVAWTDGEVIQGINTNANTSTTPTLNVNGRGAKTIATVQGLALSAGSMSANSLVTLRYDGLLDKLLLTSGGITVGAPIEAQVQLCNRIGVNFWAVLPSLADDNYVSNWAAYIRDNLTSSLLAYLEYGNEVWNPGFAQTSWSYQRGLALGMPNANQEPLHCWYGLRCRQIFAAITSLWGARGGLKRVMAWQAYETSTQVNPYRLQGGDLASVANGGKGNATWISWTGDSNYRSSPNRPVDYADVLSYATYYQGATVNDGNAYTNAANTVVLLPAANVTALQAMIDNYTSGAVSTALAALDANIRSGTNTNVAKPQTLADLVANIYPTWETVAAGYTGKTVEAYEGGLQIKAPTQAQCNKMGLVSPNPGGTDLAASQAVASLILAYKNSPQYQKLLADQFDQYLAQSHSVTPSWLNITGGGQWALLSGNILSTPFQLYYAFKNYNNRKRRIQW